MPLSTSSFERTIPELPWRKILFMAIAIFVTFVLLLECLLAFRGFEPTVRDSPELWVKHRLRASNLGKQALILVGSSRMMLGLDLEILSSILPRVPVQLAINGSSSFSVIGGLAKDDSIRGTIIVDYYDHTIAGGMVHDEASQHQKLFELHRSNSHSWSSPLEYILTSSIYEAMRSYADGARPVTSYFERAISPSVIPQYLHIHRSRSRDADYNKVPMPGFYFARAFRNAGIASPFTDRVPTIGEVNYLLDKIDSLQPADNAKFLQNLHILREWIKRLQERGGDVIFVRLPVSGFVRMINEKCYPRTSFFDHVGPITNAVTVDFSDYSTTAHFTCPDGSHLDLRDKAAFTTALADILKPYIVPSSYEDASD